MSFLGSWRSHDSVMDGLGAQPFIGEARMTYARLQKMSPRQIEAFRKRIDLMYDRLPPHLQRLVDQILERNPSFDPRSLHGDPGLGNVASTIGNIAQAAAAIGGVALAYQGQREARKDAEAAARRQHELEKERLAFEQQQAQQQLELQRLMMSQQAAGGNGGAPAGGMAEGTKKALLVGGAVAAAGVVALAASK